MKYLSVCSGIEAITVAWHDMGFTPVAFSEIDRFPSAVLASRFPIVPNLGDMTRYKEWDVERGSVDILVGGTPCQSFSVAGLRKGLDDPRGNLALVYLGIAERFAPKWILWENVPGVLSSGGGRDFGSFLGALVKLGYGFAYRVLDAQFCGVPQRRRRVFVVGHLGDWGPAAAVLFERESMRRNSAPGRKPGEETTGTLASRSSAGGGIGTDFDLSGGLQVPVLSHACLAKGGSGRLDGSSAGPMGTLRTGHNEGGGVPFVAGTLGANHGNIKAEHAWTNQLVPLAIGSRARGDDGRGYDRLEHISTTAGTVDATKPERVLTPMAAVRRLTPRECERLQGFPDDFTLVEYNGKPAKDGPRYKAIGNSMAVPVVRWIGSRILLVESLL